MEGVGRLIMTAGAVVVLVAVPAGAVRATSCAPAPDGSARAIVTGTEVLWGDHGFFDLYDYAITGTVIEVVTDEDAESDTYGATEVHVDVINGFGVEQIGESVVVHQSDPGWMNGFAFDRGATYFIPLVHAGPNGERDYSFVCDPISRISPEGAAQLIEIVGGSIAVAHPSVDATPAPTIDTGSRPDVAELSARPRSPSLLPPLLDESSTDDGPAPVLTVVALAVALAVGAVAVDVYRRRRTSPPDTPAGEPS